MHSPELSLTRGLARSEVARSESLKFSRSANRTVRTVVPNRSQPRPAQAARGRTIENGDSRNRCLTASAVSRISAGYGNWKTFWKFRSGRLLCDGNPHASDGEPPHARGLDLRWQTNGSVLTRRCTEVPTSRTNEPGSRRSTSPQPAAQFLSCSRSGHGRLACAWKFDFAASRGSGNPNRFTIDCNVVRLRPTRVAASRGPPITQLVSSRTRATYARSMPSSILRSTRPAGRSALNYPVPPLTPHERMVCARARPLRARGG